MRLNYWCKIYYARRKDNYSTTRSFVDTKKKKKWAQKHSENLNASLFTYRSAQEKRLFCRVHFANKSLIRELSRKKSARFRVSSRRPFFLREISQRNSAKTRRETPRTFAQIHRKNLVLFQKKFWVSFILFLLLLLFCLICGFKSQSTTMVMLRRSLIPVTPFLRARLGSHKTGLRPPVFLNWPFQGGTSVVVPYCYLFLLSVFILWFSYYVSDIFCKF